MEIEAEANPQIPTSFSGITRLNTISSICDYLPEGIRSKLFFIN
jgi:hypothetical protein